MRIFIKEDDINAVHVTMKKSILDAPTLKKCFRGKHEIQQRAYHLFSDLMAKLMEIAKISQVPTKTICCYKDNDWMVE